MPTTTWRDHPLFIAGATVGATLIFSTVVLLPFETATMQNKIDQLEQQTRDYAPLKKRADELQAELNKTKVQLATAQLTHLFEPGNPYPVGLRQVKIGDPLDMIDRTFIADSIDKTKTGYWSVRNQHTQFRDVTYYFSNDKRVTRLLLFMKNDTPRGFLRAKFIEAFGPPAVDKEGCASWKVNDSFLYIDNDGTSYSEFFGISTQLPPCARLTP